MLPGAEAGEHSRNLPIPPANAFGDEGGLDARNAQRSLVPGAARVRPRGRTRVARHALLQLIEGGGNRLS